MVFSYLFIRYICRGAELQAYLPVSYDSMLAQGIPAAIQWFEILSQAGFAAALGISVHTLRNWEQGRRTPEGPALSLMRIAARHPSIVREAAKSAA